MPCNSHLSADRATLGAMKAVPPSRCRHASTASPVCLQLRSVRAMHLEQSHRRCFELLADHQGARNGSPCLSRFAWVLCLLVSLTAAAQKPPELKGSMVISREKLAAFSGASPEPALPLASLEDGLGQPFPELVAHPVRLLTTREEPAEILQLRRRAKRMVQQMANFRALQTLRLNSEGQPELVWFHELYVHSGHLVFRAVDDGQVMQALPFPSQLAVLPGAEWRDLPQMVASEFKLRVEEVGSKDVGGKPFRVFRYQASVEDRVCWVYFRKTGRFRSHDRQFPVACRGEVWTDAELNAMRISRELEIPAGKVPMQLVQVAVLYGWLGHDLVPVEMTVHGMVAGHACRSDAHFSNYRLGQFLRD